MLVTLQDDFKKTACHDFLRYSGYLHLSLLGLDQGYAGEKAGCTRVTD